MKKEKKKPDEKVTLTVTRDQALVLERACEVLARLQIGQFEMIPLVAMLGYENDGYLERREDARDALKLAACLIFGRNLYGQPNCSKNDEFNRAWMLYEVLRYTRAWHDNPDGDHTGVCYDKPMQWISGEAMPKCEIKDGGA